MGRLEGKVALITGAARGMGKVAAALFAGEGAAVVVADVTDDAGQATVEEITSAGGSAAYVHANVSSPTDAGAMVRFAVERFGGLHVLYNNAGIFPADDGSVTETPEATWDRVMSINLKGVFLGCKYGIPAMLDSGGGSIINVASFVALMGAATPQIAYTASKGGVLSMTREIAVEFARRNIRATCGFRIVGEHKSFRVESRIPGADANPYYAFAATIAGGLHGIDNKLDPPEMFRGNAYEAKEVSRVPSSLHKAIDAFDKSEVARKAFGDPVFEHLLNTARQEQIIFDNNVVTDWELQRYFERI
ncbi:MAG TPA: SDR family NAD(P)-dependent oxidoreductase [Actinomycetota bacterium]